MAIPILASACGRNAGGPVPAPVPTWPAAAAWTYDVRESPGARELFVEAHFPAGTPAVLGFEDDAERFVRELAVKSAAGWRGVTMADSVARIPECLSRGCSIRYKFLLADAANAIGDIGTAAAFGAAFEAPASTWLLHPGGDAPHGYRLHVRAPTTFLSGIPPEKSGAPGAYAAEGGGLEVTPYSAFGAWRVRRVVIGGAQVTLGISRDERAMTDDAIALWITRAAEGISAFYGHFPSQAPLILVLPGEGTSIDGQTLGGGGGSVALRLGPAVTPPLAEASWVATHEMVHLNLPSFGRPHQWLEEGIATYIEPIIRARAKVIDQDSVWRDLLRQASQGLPRAGDEGLERTHTWGRTYWGGAVFCLLADVRIRKLTHNARSFSDVLRAVVATGATVATQWDIARFLDIGDAAASVPAPTRVLAELYAQLALAPGNVDLPALWARLGVSLRGETVVYDDTAVDADVRRAMVAP